MWTDRYFIAKINNLEYAFWLGENKTLVIRTYFRNILKSVLRRIYSRKEKWYFLQYSSIKIFWFIRKIPILCVKALLKLIKTGKPRRIGWNNREKNRIV